MVAFLSVGLSFMGGSSASAEVERVQALVKEARATLEVAQAGSAASPVSIRLEAEDLNRDSLEPAPVEEPAEPVTPHCPGYEGLRIVGHVRLEGQTGYVVKQSGDGGQRVLVSRTVAPFVLEPAGACFVEISGGDCRSSISC